MANLETTLKRINRQTEESAAQHLASALGLTYALLDDYPFNLESLRLLPVEKIEQKRYAAYLKTASRIRFAVVHPEDQTVIAELTALGIEWGVEIEVIVVSASSFEYLVHRYIHLLEEERLQAESAKAEVQHQAEKDYVKKIKTLEDLAAEVSHASITELIDAIIAAAYNAGASDIHIEPSETELMVRFRVDGILQKVLSLQMTQLHHLVSRIRLMSAMKIDTETATQDGRFSMANRGINADFRVSIVPTGYGPGIVMRILRQDIEMLSLQDLGFTEHNLQLIEKSIHRPYGLIVVTGPTGSGKSTSLYSMLSKINSSEKKILTLEDPIEYRLAGVQQSQIDPDHGYTFAEGLKGALRQDPDIVMVGEIRDPETATIALNASLTGHLVLSTLHTNDAVTAHVRFLELGVEPFLLSGSIQVIVAQRLVRKLVPGSDPKNPQYKGRIVIAEVLCPTQEFEQAVLRHADQETLRSIAVKGGMIPMLQDGMDKVRAGLTTEEEVYRVTAG